MLSNRRLRSGAAFLIAATGLGICGYAGLLWRGQPHYSDAEIEKSVELNLVLDLAREGRRTSDLDQVALDLKRQTTRAEVEADLKSENQRVTGWFVSGMILLLFASIQTWLGRRPRR